ncbi:MAG: GGDEF domain-containing protein [Lachnospiraceae bacterium]|nr:GGDEF domain-containing protein [Lachnospiraceae bacterium]
MDIVEFQQRKNRMVFGSWVLIATVLTGAYILEFFNGNRDIIYVIQFTLFTWIPLMISYGVHLIIGRSNTNIRYTIAVAYLIFYFYTQITSNSLATFIYIIPMMCALIVYDDVKLLDMIFIAATISNVILIASNIANLSFLGDSSTEAVTRETITFYEIEIACLILSGIFIHRTTVLVTYSSHKLNELNDEINHDELTNVYNRYYLTNFIKDNFEDVKINGEQSNLSLAVVDVDSFKSINDSYGHKFGDLVLRRIASILRDKSDDYSDAKVVRLGGDEFIIISTEITKDDIFELCERACKEVSDVKLRYGDEVVTFTVSIGVANSVEDNCNTYSKLYELADSMLYTVKTNGKCSVAKA